ncbi:MAG: hypothetical protein WCZ27_04565 [Tissierellaceae bacterium]
MGSYLTSKRIYLYTAISFFASLVFLYGFAKTAPIFYTGFDMYTSPNFPSRVADFLFKFLLVNDLTGAVLSIILTVKALIDRK